MNSSGGSEVRAVAATTESQWRSAGFAPAELMIKDIATLAPGNFAGKLGAFLVIDAPQLLLIAEVSDRRGCVPEFKACRVHARGERQPPYIGDKNIVSLIRAVVLRRTVGRLVHVVVNRFVAWRDVMYGSLDRSRRRRRDATAGIAVDVSYWSGHATIKAEGSHPLK
jgi:hypothetical protein